MMERTRWWLNFGEDGAWAWWWHVARSGCWRGHAWQVESEWEDTGYSSVVTSQWRECSRCGAWGGQL